MVTMMTILMMTLINHQHYHYHSKLASLMRLRLQMAYEMQCLVEAQLVA